MFNINIKDARSVSFRSILFTSYILTIFKQRNYSRKYEKLPNRVIHACNNNTEKMYLLKMSGPQICFCLLNVSTHSVEKVKWLDYNRNSQLTWWCSGNAWVQEVQSPAPTRDFMFDFLFCCCCVFTFLSKTHYLSQKFAIPFIFLIYLVYLRYCKIYDRL